MPWGFQDTMALAIFQKIRDGGKIDRCPERIAVCATVLNKKLLGDAETGEGLWNSFVAFKKALADHGENLPAILDCTDPDK